ncbi:hypothetical protein ILYODFUR_032604 [Ilyodon furcidens]|uniref:NADH dehydrogenase subunit 1 n=1 Tax=Ilyodon furcidens TaxID=33524 RepID=A0ABV0V0Z5_9TELE
MSKELTPSSYFPFLRGFFNPALHPKGVDFPKPEMYYPRAGLLKDLFKLVSEIDMPMSYPASVCVFEFVFILIGLVLVSFCLPQASSHLFLVSPNYLVLFFIGSP